MTRILIVDDNEEDLYMLQVLLKGHGYEVTSATNGAEALETARRDPPDMIVTDILMPIMDGFSLCRQWRKDAQLKEIPFVFYTATYTDPWDQEFGLSLGADRFIIKPIEPDVFVGILLEVIAEHEAGQLVVHRETVKEETVYLREYNAALIRKLEDKLVELEEANQALERDIAGRKRAEAEREALIAELEAKNAELERFTYTVSHDLKSPLITIQGFLGFVEQAARTGNIEQMQADMARIANAVSKMEQLLHELLELSRIGRLMNPPEAVPLADLTQEAVDTLAGRLAERGVEIIIAPDLPLVYGDRPRLREVLENLIDNAVKYMGDQPQPRVDIGARYDGAEPVFYVRDNGIGIDPRYHEKIFGLFEKLDQQTEGSGVGLTIAKRIVEMHGGRIWVESDGVGRGSAFCFTLPGARQ
jgi:signal transduction histidine kinase